MTTDADLVDAIEAKFGPLTGGQVLVLRNVTFEDMGETLLTALIECARERGLTGNAAEHVPFIVCLADPSASIELLDEDDMRAAGWVRV